MPRHQTQVIIKNLIKVSHSVVNDYDINGMQVRINGSSEKQRKLRNAYCAHRVLTRALNRRKLCRIVNLFYKHKHAEIEAAFPGVFTVKGQAGLDLR